MPNLIQEGILMAYEKGNRLKKLKTKNKGNIPRQKISFGMNKIELEYRMLFI